MRLTPRETDKLMLHLAGSLAGERKKRGLKLNYPEAIAYISSELLELARDGHSVTELMYMGTKILTSEDVMEGVPEKLQFGVTEARAGLCVRALAKTAQDIEELFADLAEKLELDR